MDVFLIISFVSTVTTADAVVQGPTVLAHVLTLTVVVHRLADISLLPSSPISSPRPATTATVIQSPVDATATAEDLVTRGSAHVLGHAPARLSKWKGTGRERGNGRESGTAAPMTSPQRNTNMSEVATIEETGERGRDLGPMTGTERGSVATRANTTAVVDILDTAATGVETLNQLVLGLIVTDATLHYSESQIRSGFFDCC